MHDVTRGLERGMAAGKLSIPEGLPLLLSLNDDSWCGVKVRAWPCMHACGVAAVRLWPQWEGPGQLGIPPCPPTSFSPALSHRVPSCPAPRSEQLGRACAVQEDGTSPCRAPFFAPFKNKLHADVLMPHFKPPFEPVFVPWCAGLAFALFCCCSPAPQPPQPHSRPTFACPCAAAPHCRRCCREEKIDLAFFRGASICSYPSLNGSTHAPAEGKCVRWALAQLGWDHPDLLNATIVDDVKQYGGPKHLPGPPVTKEFVARYKCAEAGGAGWGVTASGAAGCRVRLVQPCRLAGLWAPAVAAPCRLCLHHVPKPASPAPCLPASLPPSPRYVLNADGSTATYRLAYLLATNSVILKQASTQIEWWVCHVGCRRPAPV